MAKFLDLSVNGIALGSVSSGTNQTQAFLSTPSSNVLQVSGTNTSTLCRLTGVDQPTTDSDATNRLYVQSYVLGQIRGLQMKPSVKLCSTTAVSLSSAVTSYSYAGPYTQAAVLPGNIVTRRMYPTGQGDSVAEASSQLLDPTFFRSTGKLSIAFKWQYSSMTNCNPFGVNLGFSGSSSGIFFMSCPSGANFSFSSPRSPTVSLQFSQSQLPANTDIYIWWCWDYNAQVSKWDIATLQNGVLVPVDPLSGSTSHPQVYSTGYGLSGGLPTGAPSTWSISDLNIQGWGAPETFSDFRIKNKT